MKALSLPLLLASASAAAAVENDWQKEGESITVKEIDELLAKLKSDKPGERWNAASAILDLDKEAAPVLKKRLHRPAKASGESMKRVLYSLRKKLKEEMMEKMQQGGRDPGTSDIEPHPPPEFLRILIERKQSFNEAAWRGAAEIMTLLLALASMQTRDSILAVLDFSGEQEAAFRKEIYQIMNWLGERALPAMIMRKNSRDENIAIVVGAYLSKMNMVRPGQQVQVKNPSILAEILRVFGEQKDFEAIDSITPFLNAENPVVRGAARRSILMFSKSSLWALRREYRNYTGGDPDSSWQVEKIAEELFRVQDGERLAPFDKKMKEGLDLAREKKFREMEKNFHDILAASPMYERKSEMVPGYVEATRHYIDAKDYEKASILIRTARRINQDPGRDGQLLALFYYVESLRSMEEGIADPDLMKKAIMLDPDLEGARAKLKEIEKIYRGRKIRGYRILAAGGIGMTALLVLILIIIKKW